MQLLLCKYQPAKIYAGKSYWYIYYKYRHPRTGKFERFKEYFDVNRIKDRRKFINKKLIEGFNPFEAMVRKEMGGTIMVLLDVLFKAMCVGATDSMINSYQCFFNRFRKFLEEKEATSISLNDVDSTMADLFKEWMVEKKLAKKTINETFSYLSMFWKKAIKMGLAFGDPIPNRTVSPL